MVTFFEVNFLKQMMKVTEQKQRKRDIWIPKVAVFRHSPHGLSSILHPHFKDEKVKAPTCPKALSFEAKSVLL